MADFSDVLLTVDFDRTLTATDSTIPQRNIEAIEYFMAQGGTFTVNTGRSTNTFKNYLNTLPVNAPLLLMNGSARYQNGRLEKLVPIDLPLWETVETISNLFPEMNLELQGAENHYLYKPRQSYIRCYEGIGWDWAEAIPHTDVGPFLKLSLFGTVYENSVGGFFEGPQEELDRFVEARKTIERLYGEKVDVLFAAPRIIDVHANGASKLRAARSLQKELGKSILVCVGDADNDKTMPDGADYAYCPADGVVADQYENVCRCSDGAVADVIYNKIPEILKIEP